MKVSIIVPIYNIENYIERCLRSLINQSYSNIEIIAVDDGSYDSSTDILDRLANEDSRIIPLHKKNGGLSSARNYGLKYISGDFVMFVDGDDYLEDSCVETLVKLAKDKYDLIVFPYTKEYSDHSIKTSFGLEPEIELDQDLLFQKLIGPDSKTPFIPVNIDHFNTAWGKLYRTEIINNIKFVDTQIIGIEDAWFNMCVLSHNSIRVFYTEKTWYHYEKENMSSLLHQYKPDNEVKKWTLYNRIKILLEETDKDDLIPNLNRRIICEQFSLLSNFCGSDMTAKDVSKRMNEIYRMHDYDTLYLDWNPKQVSLPWRIFYQLCRKRKFALLIVLLRIFLTIMRK